jgi:hypothetical protein
MRPAVLALPLLLALVLPAAAIPDLSPLDQYGGRSLTSPVVTPSKYCGVGNPPVDGGKALFGTDFETAPPAVKTAGSTNFWHVTSFAGQGLEPGHSGAMRLYYGVERPQGGTFNFGRTFGAITFAQPIAIPATGETLITWNEKWEVEWGAFGVYDAMAVQLVDSPAQPYSSAGGPAGGPIHALSLCLSSPWDPVPQSADPGSGIPACSPNLAAPCASPPAWMPRHEFVDDHLKGRVKYLRLNFDAMDTLYNDFLGWMVDDVRVLQLGP